jgi:signal transduction histidine kinase
MQPSKRSIERDPGYRKFYFKEDLKNATLALAFSIISISGFIVNDFLFFGYAPFFFALLSLRLGVIGVIGIAIYYIHKTQTPKMFDTLIFLVLIVELVSGGFVNMFRPPDFVAQAIVTIIFVCVFYLIIPYRFFYQCLFSTIATLGEIFIIVFVAHPSAVPVLFTVIFTLIITNVVAALGSWAMHSYRRRNYQEFLHRKQAQTRLQEHSDQLEKIVEERTQELKATERFAAIGATAGMVGHDLRNPLTGISNASYYLKKKYSQQIDDSGKEMLDIIQRNVEYSNKIINDLLEYQAT